MIRLQTFGGAVLFGDDGARLLGAASQRRILALVSVLAASGEGGLTRDKLVGILWPTSPPRLARHSLTQTMYAARKALGCDDLVEATEDVRLNPARVSSDVADFEAALRSGDEAGAAALYRGPFLDGFYMSSSEFDWWLHHQRTRLENEAVAALLRLATAAEDAGDWEAAAGWLRRLEPIRPADSGLAIRLMKTLSAAGDRAGAVQHAAVHARLLREQYEMEPDAEVLALAAELREPPQLAATGANGSNGANGATGEKTLATVVATAGVAAAGASGVIEAGSGLAGVPGSPAEDSPHDRIGLERPREEARAAPPRLPVSVEALPVPAAAEALSLVRKTGRLAPGAAPNRLAGGRWRLVAAALVLVAAGLLVWWFVHPRARRVAYPSLDQQVVVTPFRVAGADPALEYLRDGMVEVLSTRLADDTAARSVDAGAVLAAWRQAGITRNADVSRDSIVRLAARLGAQRVVVGSVVGTPARMIVNATVLAVPSGNISGQATVEGSAEGLAQLVDQLAARLLLVEAGESDRLTEHLTQSLPALRAYLAGAAADAHGDYALSTRQYARVLGYDSTFALSALRLAVAAARLNDYELERQALHRAWRFGATLSDRDQGHLRAMLGPRYPAPSTAGQAIAAWEEAARLAPNRAEVWVGLAERIRTDGAAAGLGDVRERTLAALQHAIELDRNDAGARLLFARLGGQGAPPAPRRDTAALPLSLFFQWWAAAQRSDAAALTRLAGALPTAGPSNLRAIAAAGEFEALHPADAARALEVLAARATDGDQKLGILLAQHSLAMERGQPAAALEITRRIQRLEPASRAHLRLRVLDALFGEGDAAAAASAAQELLRTASSADLPNVSADACVLAQWQIARSDTAGARATLALLRQARPADALPAFVGSPAPMCTALVEAGLAVATSRPDARAQVARADSLVLTSAVAGDVATYAPLLISRLYRRLGQPVLALDAIRRRPQLAAIWPRYLATELRDEGALARAAGDPTGALAAYREYLALRDAPEPALRPQVQEVRALADALAARR